MYFKKDKLLIFIITVLCVASIIPFIIIGFYSRPSADDFSYSYTLYNIVKSGNYNLIELLIEAFKVSYDNYFAWQGTYTSGVIMALQPGIFGDKYYCVGVFSLMILMFLCLYKFIETLKKVVNVNLPTWFLSLLFFTCFVQTAPDICQCFYWLCGAYHYVPFFFLDLLIISYSIEYLQENNKKKRKILIVLSSALSFIVSGGNQVTSFFNILLLCLFLAYSIYRKKPNGLYIPLLSAIFGFIVMFIAPGNSVRSSNAVQSGIIESIINSFKATFKYIPKWFSLSCLMFVIIINILFYIFADDSNTKLDINPLFVFLLSYCLFAAMFCPTNYAMSSNGAGRLKNVIHFAGVIFIAIDTCYLQLWLKQRHKPSININNIATGIILVALSIIMCCSMHNNDVLVTKELLNGTAEKFADSFDDRIEYINSSNEEVVSVKRLYRSEILYFDDITDDMNDWRNIGWYQYYGVKTVLFED